MGSSAGPRLAIKFQQVVSQFPLFSFAGVHIFWMLFVRDKKLQTFARRRLSSQNFILECHIYDMFPHIQHAPTDLVLECLITITVLPTPGRKY